MKRSKTRLLFLLGLVLLLTLAASTALAGKLTLTLQGTDRPVGNYQWSPDTTFKVLLAGKADDGQELKFTLTLSRVTPSKTIAMTTKEIKVLKDGKISFKYLAKDLNKLPAGEYKMLVNCVDADTQGYDPVVDERVGVYSVMYTITTKTEEGVKAVATPTHAMPGDPILLEASDVKGYYFTKWECLEGDVVLRNGGVKKVAFEMPAHNVTFLAKGRPNVPKKDVAGETSDDVVTPAEPAFPTRNLLGSFQIRTGFSPTGVMLSAAPMYALPSVQGSLIAQVPAQGQVTIVGMSGDFFLALFGDKMGYVDAGSVSSAFEQALRGQLAYDQPLYTLENQSAGISMPAGTREVVGRLGDKWQVMHQGQLYLLPAMQNGQPTFAPEVGALLSLAAPYTFPATGHANGSVNLRQSATTDSNRVGGTKNGEMISVVGFENGFFLMSREDTGFTAYVSSEYVSITFSPPIYGQIAQQTGCYSQPNSVQRNFVDTLREGAAVTLMGKEGPWWKAIHNGQTVWVHASYVSLPVIY